MKYATNDKITVDVTTAIAVLSVNVLITKKYKNNKE